MERSEAWISAFIDQLAEGGLPDRKRSELQEARDKLLAGPRRGLERVGAEGPDASLDLAAEVGIEAIIETDGSRPVFFRPGRQAQSSGRQAGRNLANASCQFGARYRTRGESRGQVNDSSAEQRFQGTAFMVAPGLVMTNLHVLQAIASKSDGSWLFKSDFSIDFARERNRDRTVSFAVKEVVFAGPEPIDPWSIEHDLFDLALLSIEDGTPSRKWPLPLPITTRPKSDDAPRTIVSCGFKDLDPTVFADAMSADPERTLVSIIEFLDRTRMMPDVVRRAHLAKPDETELSLAAEGYQRWCQAFEQAELQQLRIGQNG